MSYVKAPKNRFLIDNPHNQFDEIKDLIICPICQSKVIFNENKVKCTNISCGMDFPIINNIPILINEEESIFSINSFFDKDDKLPTFEKRIKLKLKRLQAFFPSLSNNLSSKRNFKLLDELLLNLKNPKILIIGGATITSDTEIIFKQNRCIIESDVYIGPRTQIVIDSHNIPFENQTFDLVIFQAVLEYVADPNKCVNEAYRVLKGDGLIFAATPFMQQTIAGLVDYTRFTQLGHRRLFRAFDEINSGVFAGSGVALGWSIRTFVGSLTNIKFIRFILKIFISFLFFWLKYIDYFVYDNKGTIEGASGFYFIGKKRETVISDKELLKLCKMSL